MCVLAQVSHLCWSLSLPFIFHQKFLKNKYLYLPDLTVSARFLIVKTSIAEMFHSTPKMNFGLSILGDWQRTQYNSDELHGSETADVLDQVAPATASASR